MTDYEPVDCGLHSKYELLVMQAVQIQIIFRDTDLAMHTDTGVATDLFSKNGEEFLSFSGTHSNKLIRLDRIIACELL